MALLAAGSVASLAAPTVPLAEPPARKPAARPTLSPAIEKGIREQKASLAEQLKVIRDYELPPGADMAFVFRPVRSRRSR